MVPGKIDDVDKYITAKVTTTVFKPFEDFLRAMLGANQHLVDKRYLILHSIASSVEVEELRNNYCKRVYHGSKRCDRFCELANHIISQLPGEAQRPPFVFCRTCLSDLEDTSNNNHDHNIVVLSGQYPSVDNNKWKDYSSSPQDASLTWLDIQHIFNFKLNKKQIKYTDEASPPKLDKWKAPNNSADDNFKLITVSQLVVTTNQHLNDLANPSFVTTEPTKKRRREHEEDDSNSENRKRQCGETQPFDTPDSDLLRQSILCAFNMMLYAPNLRHVIFGLVRDGNLWMCYFDRGNIVCSQRLIFVNDLYLFVVLMKALIDLRPTDRGFIQGSKMYDPKDFDEIYIHLTRAPSSTDTSNDLLVTDTYRSKDDMSDEFLTADNASHQGNVPFCDSLGEDIKDRPRWYFTIGPHEFLIRDSLTGRRPTGLTGKTSRVDVSTCGTLDPSDHNRMYALKTSWPEDKRRNEADTIRLAKKVMDNLDKTKSFRERHGISGRYLPDCLPRVFLSEDIIDPIDGFKSRLGVILEKQIFRVIAFEQLYPIYMAVNVDIFKQLFFEIFQGHRFLFNCLRFIKHRDISVENLMYRKMPDGTFRGVLNDRDLTKVRKATGINPKGTRAGTQPFMSRDLLVPNPPDHLERFDWESMFYVLFWIACHYIDGEDINPEALKDWLQHDMTMLRSAKRGAFNSFLYEMTTAQFRPLAKLWLNPLRKLFFDGYEARDNHKNEAGDAADKGETYPEFDNETLGGHVTYEKMWAILRL
ncbi:hypothetical protein EW145_g2313 [Phellinidium pouzarii]|uniref:Fungal-type protein kinase domain-containing protein n=1 Tax=Phellinidium pouzarii TaxID=167371 RepID=A0A4S4LBJ3_9AGAM|nr:hypothetical protein EW145_g2313 [Phellinidium pouzarii]